MKIALVHDYLREYGGAERVVEAFHQIWPEAPLYTSFVDWDALGIHANRFKDWDIRPSWAQSNPIVKRFHSPLRFLAPKIWESFDLSSYNLVLSSSGWFICRGVRAGHRLVDYPYQPKDFPNASVRSQISSTKPKLPLHICYIHHPPRNLYGYPTGSSIQRYPLVRAYAHVVNFFLRHYDYETAQRVDYFIANSHETAKRVEKFYRRPSTVIYPPVELESNIKEQKLPNSRSSRPARSYFLAVGRFSWAKRIDLAIQACVKLSLPLKIIGAGKEERSLRQLAGPTIEFIGAVSDEKLRDYYRGAKAVIFTSLEEDFGIVPVEAMSFGTPVIALAQGGVRETVIDGRTGIWFHEPTVPSLSAALKKFISSPSNSSWEKNCLKQAIRFGKDRFRREVVSFVRQKLSESSSSALD